jgi:hypothetical protein
MITGISHARRRSVRFPVANARDVSAQWFRNPPLDQLQYEVPAEQMVTDSVQLLRRLIAAARRIECILQDSPR